MNILFLDNCTFIKHEKLTTKQASAMHPVCGRGVSATNGFWAILDVAYKSYINMCVRVGARRAVQQRAPL